MNASLVGVLFLTFGNGGITCALQYVDSGLTALLVSAQPLVLLFMLWAIDKKPLPLLSWVGVFLGMLGIYLLLSQNQLVSRENQLLGIGLIFFSLICWGTGSIIVSRKDMPSSHMTNTAIQMIVGGFIMLVISLVWEGSWGFDFAPVRHISWFALAYLAIFAGAVSFTSFNYLLKHVSTEKVVTSTYVNPVIALWLGWMFRDELLTSTSLIATIVLLTGVYFINQRKTTPVEEFAEEVEPASKLHT